MVVLADDELVAGDAPWLGKRSSHRWVYAKEHLFVGTAPMTGTVRVRLGAAT